MTTFQQIDQNIFRETYVSGFLLHKQIVNLLTKIINPAGNMAVVLDAGCGRQPYRSVVEGLGAKYVGIDIQNSILQGYAGPDTLSIGLDGVWPLGDKMVDVVLSTQVLEHVEQINNYLNESRRVLKPGGKLLLSTHGNYRFHGTYDFWRWTYQGLELLLSEHNYFIISILPVLTSEANLVFLFTDLVLSKFSQKQYVGILFRYLVGLANRFALSIDRTGRRSTDLFPCILLVLAEGSNDA